MLFIALFYETNRPAVLPQLESNGYGDIWFILENLVIYYNKVVTNIA